MTETSIRNMTDYELLSFVETFHTPFPAAMTLIGELQQRLGNAHDDLEELQREYDTLDNDTTVIDERDAAWGRVDTLEREAEALNERIDDLEAELETANAELAALEDYD